ncbi:AraC family transcriptional regulator [Actinoallomurus sp. NPDC050550]|uniref:helix-turn-helix domain-containing protein n=1 Tax=Actinoallomurus sp. NPDC050550 TaxID=3154937 RepID=UPI0033F8AF78
MRVGPQPLESSGGRRASVDGRPAPALRGRVLAYTGYRETAPTSVRRRETPAGEVILILGFGKAHHAQPTPDAHGLRPFTSFIAGFHDRPTLTGHDGGQFGLQVRLDPLGAFALFGVPAHELSNRIVPLSDLFGAAAEHWTERLADLRSWPARFALLDALLAERIAAGPAPSSEVASAWQAMRRVHGAVRIAELATRTGRSDRYLAARFRQQIGTTPKNAARVLRYEHAARLLARGDLPPAHVAVVCGYADQAHLTREFTRFAATTPAVVRRWAA